MGGRCGGGPPRGLGGCEGGGGPLSGGPRAGGGKGGLERGGAADDGGWAGGAALIGVLCIVGPNCSLSLQINR